MNLKEEWLRDLASAKSELEEAKRTGRKINEIQIRIKGIENYIRMIKDEYPS